LAIRPKLGQLVLLPLVKLGADRIAIKNGVPVVPGTPGPVDNPEAAHAFVEEYGFPVIIKVYSR
jgi:biotin carboxylase